MPIFISVGTVSHQRKL